MPEEVTTAAAADKKTEEGADKKPVDMTAVEERLKQTDAKLEQLTTTNQQLSQMLQDTNASIQQTIKPAKTESDSDSLKDLIYEDPEKAIKVITDKVTEKVTADVNKANDTKNAAATEKQHVINNLSVEYPELLDPKHELRTKAVEFFSKMSVDQQNSVLASEVAIRNAAAQMGLLPKDQRKKMDDNNDDFSLSNSNQRSEKPTKKGELDQRTVDFANLCGLDVEDEKVVERLKKYAGRKNYGKYE